MKKRGIIGTLILCAAGCGMLLGSYLPSKVTAAETKALAAKIYELRTYHTNPGKMPKLHARFSEHTNQLFKKHGIQVIGYWTPAEGADAENTLIYIVAHESREAAKKAWAEFGADPEWKKVFAESEADGKIVNKVESVYMNPTDYSPLR